MVLSNYMLQAGLGGRVGRIGVIDGTESGEDVGKSGDYGVCVLLAIEIR